jgi:phosphoserine phosphatase RsbU/P
MRPSNARYRFDWLLCLVLLLAATSLTVRAQTFSLQTGREPVASLDGLWRFHTGDNPQWADPSFDDSEWPLLRSDKSWARQGYKDYSGYAWYRFHVAVPAGLDHVSLLLPPIMTSYQVFVDGKQVGNFGKIPSPAARILITAVYLPLPAEFHLNLAGPSTPRVVTVALRVWHWQGWSSYRGGGTEEGGGLIGKSTLIATRFQHIKDALLLSSGGYYSIGILCFIAGIMAFILFLVRRKETEYFWFALNQFVDATVYGVAIYEHSQVVTLLGRDSASQILELISSLSYILFLQRLLRGRRSVLFYLAIASPLASSAIYATLLSGFWPSVGTAGMGQAVCELALSLWVFDLLIRRVKEGMPDARLLLAPVLISAALTPIESALWASYQLGWTSSPYWPFDILTHPFPVSADVAVEALFLIAMLAILSNRFLRSQREEQSMVAELEAARIVQQVLIPEAIPTIPGFNLESVYKPAGQVGGDFFQILPVGNGSVLVVIGDVSGKGMPAAMTVSLLVGTVRTLAHFILNPGAILSAMNRRMLGRTSGGFTTCLVLRADPDGTLIVANAGHLPPYLNGQELGIESGVPLGLEAGAAYRESHFQLAVMDQLTLVTDGVAEARSRTGELFGFERTQAIATQPAASIAEVAQHFGQEDDITVVTVLRCSEKVYAV